MGWFWGASDSKDDINQDPLRNLDPKLREFLKKESPVKYSSSNPPSTSPALPATKPSQSAEAPSTKSSAPVTSEPTLPSASLYQDGRYADIWKSYTPQAEIEAAGKSDQEVVQDILEGFNYRKAEIGRAALENCALEQWEVNECFQTLNWSRTKNMCRTENKKFERCYVMQSKFLKALGYLNSLERPQEVDERIQMHADTLYHRMIDQEKQIEEAKAEGRPMPTFPPILSDKAKVQPGTESTTETVANTTSDDNQIQASNLKPKVQDALKKRLEGLSDDERILEERAIQAEIRAGAQVAGHLTNIFEKQEAERMKRKEAGKETVSDKLTSLLRWS